MRWYNLLSTLLTIVLLAGGCDNREPQPQLEQISVEVVSTTDDPIYMNNCGGTANATQTARRSIETNIQGSATLQFFAVNVSAQYGQGKNVEKSIEVIAPPGTNMEFILRWTEEKSVGKIVANGQSGEYSVLVPLSVELVSSHNLQCGTNQPERVAVPTGVPLTATPRKVSTPRSTNEAGQPTTYLVSSREKWQDTGVFVSAGDLVAIQYIEGSWTGATVRDRWYDGNGDLILKYRCADRVPNPSNCDEPMPQAYSGALIAKVGTQLIDVGNYSEFIVKTAGHLLLRMNDKDEGVDDNEGSITVQITVL